MSSPAVTGFSSWMKLFGDAWPASSAGVATIAGTTDNLGNTSAVSKMMSSKFPLVVIIAELFEQLRQRGFDLNLQWAPRDENAEADALTNGDFGEFAEDKRITTPLEDINFAVLPMYMQVAEDLHQQTLAARQRSAQEKQTAKNLTQRNKWRSKAKQKKLRETQPWGK